MKIELPFWLLSATISGREEDEKSKNAGDDGDENEEDEEEEHEEDEEESEDEDEDDKDKVDHEARAKALEESLRKERKLRRQAEREARKNSKAKTKDDDTKDAAELQKRLQAQEAKTARLSEGLLNSSLNQAILDEARRQGFIDPTDALTDAVRKEVDVDQDEEDPSDIDIDQDSVKDAVADLARRKKHLVGEASKGEPSGGRFKKRKTGDGPDEEALKSTYPSLAN